MEEEESEGRGLLWRTIITAVLLAAGTLLPGEVRLFSAGGAEIVLKLDGTVVINGQVFEKKEE